MSEYCAVNFYIISTVRMFRQFWIAKSTAPLLFGRACSERTSGGVCCFYPVDMLILLTFVISTFSFAANAEGQSFIQDRFAFSSSVDDRAGYKPVNVNGIWGIVLRGQNDEQLSDDLSIPSAFNVDLAEVDSDDDLDDALNDRYEVDQIGSSTLYVPTRDVPVSAIAISSQYGWKGVQDDFGEVYVLYGDCEVVQDESRAVAPIAVVWLDKRRDSKGNVELGARAYVYLEKEGSASFRFDDIARKCFSAKINENAWLGEFQSLSDVDLRIALPGEEQLRPDDVYFRAVNFLQKEIGTTEENRNQSLESKVSNASKETSEPSSTTLTNEVNVESHSPNDSVPSLTDGDSVLGWSNSGEGDVVRSIPETAEYDSLTVDSLASDRPKRQKFRLVNRYESDMSLEASNNSVNGDKSSLIVSNGFTLIVQDLDIRDVAEGETLELSADSAVIWTDIENFDVVKDKTVENADFEIYLDGNVVLREGNSVVYAKKMYYDVKNRRGIIENAEMIAEVPDMDGAFFRLGADKIVQENENKLRASNAWVSTSMMGRPTYRLQTDSLVAERSRSGLYDAITGKPAIDPKTNKQATVDKQFVIAENNFVSIGNMPVFYWPWMAMDVKDQAMYLKSLKFGHDGILGTQVRTGWDLYQLLQIKNRPTGTEWDLDLDYLSRRGFGHGSTFKYERDSLWNWDSRAVGLASFYGVYDSGFDNLGVGRRDVSFEHKYRYRGIWKHRQEFDFSCVDSDWLNASPWTFTAQVGKSSDRNFIPEFFEDEWNSSSNPETRFELKRTNDNRSLGIDVDVRTDSFYTQTNWLPKLDHYWLGQALCESPFVWYEHTKIGYAQFKSTDSPYDPTDEDMFRYLDWELSSDSVSNVSGVDGTNVLTGDSLVFSSRQEIDAPFQLGAIKTTPYALGEYGFWGQGMESQNISRLYGRLGVRFNLPVWKVDSDIESKTWYVNGVAHKMNFVTDVSYSDSSKNYDDLILYDQIDDWQVQDFRRRYSATTFSAQGPAGLDAIPVRFDERYYAIRQGVLAGSVTSPSTELVDDLQLVRLGWNNRWQTKRGSEGGRRVVDWIVLNAGINLYPKEHENFGKIPGLLDYDACWQVGDRFAVLSSGLYDVWGTGQKITRIGVQRRRPSLSSCYVGVDRLTGPIDSTYLNVGITYRTSEKWAIGFSNSFDLSEGYNIGQKLSISRIGESFVVTLGASRNESKNDWGINLSIEPVFLFDKEKRDEGLLGLGKM